MKCHTNELCEDYTTKWTNKNRVWFDDGGIIYDHGKRYKMKEGEFCDYEYKTVEVEDE